MSNTVAAETEFAPAEFGLVPIAVTTLCASEELDFDLYLPGIPPRLYRGQVYPLRDEDLLQLKAQGTKTLYVSVAEHDAYQRFVQDSLDVILQDPQLPSARRYQVLHDVARHMLEESCQGSVTDHIVDGAATVNKKIMQFILDSDLVVLQLVGVMGHDFNTYSHMLNVATCCVLLAQQLGIKKPQELEAISMGGLLHDLGKMKVPTPILNKSGRLTDEEREVVREHPRMGFEELCFRKDLSREQLMMVYRHHERIDGRGYPVGVLGDDIHAWARLCAVADFFDTKRCRRANGRSLSLQEVKESMAGQAGTRLDEEMVKCWNAALQQKR